jgi:RNA polymerase sigma-70 factor, ECF subfamily
MSTLTASRATNHVSEQELEKLFREHYQMLYRTAYSLLDNPTDAEDVPQTIFLRLLRSGLPPDMDRNPRGYLYRAAVNVSLNIIRSRKRQALRSVESIELVTSDSNPEEDTHHRLTEAIAELDASSAQILILRYAHNCSDAQIAKLLGKSRGTIAMKLFRIRGRLKKLMHSLGEQK